MSISEMRNHVLYERYIFYHESTLTNKSSIYLYKISEESFKEFIFRYENEYKFSEKVDFMFKIKNRDNKIESIQGFQSN